MILQSTTCFINPKIQENKEFYKKSITVSKIFIIWSLLIINKADKNI